MKRIPALLLFTTLFFAPFKKSVSQKNVKSFSEFKQILFKECPPPSPEDSLRASNFIDSLHKALKIKRVKIVKNKTRSSHFAFGTIYLNKRSVDSGTVCIAWIGEIPHAWQFAKHPVRTSFRIFKSFVFAFVNSYFLNESELKKVDELVKEERCPRWKAKLWVSYKRQYKHSKSFEGEAHIKIEPYLNTIILPVLNGN